MQLHSKKSKHLEISIQVLQTCNEQQIKSNYFSTTQKTFLWTKIKTKQQIQINPYGVFIGVFRFLAVNPKSMQALSHVYLPLLDFLGHVIHFWMALWAAFIDA